MKPKPNADANPNSPSPSPTPTPTPTLNPIPESKVERIELEGDPGIWSGSMVRWQGREEAGQMELPSEIWEAVGKVLDAIAAIPTFTRIFA